MSAISTPRASASRFAVVGLKDVGLASNREIRLCATSLTLDSDAWVWPLCSLMDVNAAGLLNTPSTLSAKSS